MTYKEKLYKIVSKLKDERDLTRKGYKTKATFDDGSFTKIRIIEVCKILLQLQDDEKILTVLDAYQSTDTFDPYEKDNEGNYDNVDMIIVELNETFDAYFLKIQKEPEYKEFICKNAPKREIQLTLDLSMLHPDIFNKCQSLFQKAEYPEAVEKGFKVVRDRLRTLTTYETGSEAFGKGNLHIKGAAAQNVDEDFNAGVKFLTMAIDRFRNEKSHTSDAKIDDPQRAYEYLTLSSLAMNLLDQAELLTSPKG